MRADRPEGHRDVVITVVEHGTARKHSRERWVLVDDHGQQSSMTFHTLKNASEWAAWTMAAWALWNDDSSTFCR